VIEARAQELSAADLGLLGRYEPRSWAEVSIRQHVDRGLLVADPSGGGYVPSDTFRDGARLVLDLQAEEASQLWEVDRAVLCAVLELTAAAVGMAAQSAQELPAFRQQVSTHHVLGSSPAGQLLGHMTELRYLRSDVHATALAEAGLAGPSARALHRLWRGFGPAPDQAPWQADLEGRGLIRADAEGWAATAEGVRILDEVEAATNSSFSSVLADLPERDRFTFLELARRLDGVDPRPIEDRWTLPGVGPGPGLDSHSRRSMTHTEYAASSCSPGSPSTTPRLWISPT